METFALFQQKQIDGVLTVSVFGSIQNIYKWILENFIVIHQVIIIILKHINAQRWIVTLKLGNVTDTHRHVVVVILEQAQVRLVDRRSVSVICCELVI